MIQSTDAFPLNFGFTGELEFLLVSLVESIAAAIALLKQKLNNTSNGMTSACKNK